MDMSVDQAFLEEVLRQVSAFLPLVFLVVLFGFLLRIFGDLWGGFRSNPRSETRTPYVPKLSKWDLTEYGVRCWNCGAPRTARGVHELNRCEYCGVELIKPEIPEWMV